MSMTTGIASPPEVRRYRAPTTDAPTRTSPGQALQPNGATIVGKDEGERTGDPSPDDQRATTARPVFTMFEISERAERELY
jgi:hypothetical protein